MRLNIESQKSKILNETDKEKYGVTKVESKCSRNERLNYHGPKHNQ